MADPNIELPSLPAAGSVDFTDLMLVRQGTTDKNATLQQLKELLLNGNDVSGATVLSLLLTVDGVGSNLDSDLLDGQHGSFYRNASNLSSGTVPQARLSASSILSLLLGVDGSLSGLDSDLLDGQHGSFYQNASNLNAGTVPQARLSASSILSLLLGVDGSLSGLDSDLLDGQHGSFYQNASNLNSGTIPSARVSGNYPNANVSASNLYTGTVPQARLPIATTTVQGIIEQATQTEVNSGTAGNLAVLASTLRNNVAYSLGDTGYIRFPSWLGGFTVQWGANTVAGNGTYTDAWPISFSNFFTIVCSYASTATIQNSVGAVGTNTTYTLKNSSTSSRSIAWVAFGIS